MWYNAGVALGILWLVTLLNLIGMDRAKWVQNVGAIATVLILLVTVLIGGTFIVQTDALSGVRPAEFIRPFTTHPCWASLRWWRSVLVAWSSGPLSPGGDIHIINGFAEALTEAAQIVRQPILGAIAVILVVVSTLGVFGAWLTGPARIPFVIGIAHYLPKAFASVHPRYQSPWVPLLVQGVLLNVLMIAAAAGETVTEAFLVLQRAGSGEKPNRHAMPL